MSEQKQDVSFSWWRRTFFPIHMHEIQKVIPFAIIFCGIVFTYTVCRQLKDYLMVGAGGASVIPPAKVLVMLAGVLFGFLHSKITHKYSHYHAFLISFLPFMVFFILFSIFFQHIHYVHMHPDTIIIWSKKLPALKYFIIIFGNWVYCLNYIFSEMIGTLMLGATFWQLANFYSSYDEKKRFYAFYALFAQIGSYGAGFLMEKIGLFIKQTGKLNEGVAIITLSLFITALTIVAAVTYFFKVTLKNPLYAADIANNDKKKHKKKVTNWKESVQNLKDHPTLILVCLLTVWYGICSTSMETFWKGKVSELYGKDMMIFMGQYYQITSIATFLFTLICGSLVRIFPWFVVAVITPVVVLFASFCLFGVGNPMFSGFFEKILHVNPLWLVVMVGAAVLIFFKSAKYALFDPTKEIFIGAQSEENSIQVKSLETAVGRMGKGGSAVIQTCILAIPGMTMNNMAPIMWFITTAMGIIWIYSLIRINKEMVLIEKKNKN